MSTSVNIMYALRAHCASCLPDTIVSIIDSFAEGRRCLHRQRVDVVILDIGCAGKRGIAMLKALRAITTAPCIVLTAHRRAPVRRAVRAAGATCVFFAPYDLQKLTDAVCSCLMPASRSHSNRRPALSYQ